MECAQPTSWYYTYNSELDSKKSAVQTLTVVVQLSTVIDDTVAQPAGHSKYYVRMSK